MRQRLSGEAISPPPPPSRNLYVKARLPDMGAPHLRARARAKAYLETNISYGGENNKRDIISISERGDLNMTRRINVRNIFQK